MRYFYYSEAKTSDGRWADFDRLNNMTAYSRLSDLVGYASGLYSHDSSGARVPQCAIDRSIQSASHFIMEVW